VKKSIVASIVVVLVITGICVALFSNSAHHKGPTASTSTSPTSRKPAPTTTSTFEYSSAEATGLHVAILAESYADEHGSGAATFQDYTKIARADHYIVSLKDVKGNAVFEVNVSGLSLKACVSIPKTKGVTPVLCKGSVAPAKYDSLALLLSKKALAHAHHAKRSLTALDLINAVLMYAPHKYSSSVYAPVGSKLVQFSFNLTTNDSGPSVKVCVIEPKQAVGSPKVTAC
jgi:hypothetical protein